MTQTSSAAVVAAAMLACAQIAAAQIWTGNAPKIGDVTLWTAPANWQGNAVPAAGASVVFGTGFASGLTINPNGNRSVSELFIDTTTSFTIAPIGTPATLTVGRKVERRSTAGGTQTISADVYVPYNSDFWTLNGGGGGLILDGRVTTYAGDGTAGEYGGNFLKGGDALLTLRGATSTINGTLALVGGPTLLTAGANVTAGAKPLPGVEAIHVNNAALTVNGGAKLNSRALAVIRSGGSVSVAGVGSEWLHAVTADSSVDVGADGIATLAVTDGGRVTVGNELRLGGTGAGEGTVRVTATNNVATNLFADDVLVAANVGNGRGTLAMSGNGAVAIVKTLTVGGASATGRTAAVNVDANATLFADSIALGAEAAVKSYGGQIRAGTLALRPGVTAATLNLAADPTFGSAFVLDGDVAGAATTLSDAIAVAGPGTFEKTGGTTLTLSRTTGITANLLVRGGALVLNDGLDPAAGSLGVAGGVVNARNVVNRKLYGTGGRVSAAGTLLIGDATSTAGVNYGGTIAVGNHSVLLMDADRAHVGTVTIANNGRLNSFAGLQVNGSVTATGNATIDGTFFNNGTVNGPTTAGQFLTFVDDVSGAGSYTGNVKFSDGFSPGNSPANVSLANAAFDNSTSLTMELAGTSAGTGYDRLTVSGGLALDGSLDVVTLNNFAPQLGQSFTLISGPISGAFDAVSLPTLADGLLWQTTQSPNAFTITVAAVPEPMALGAIGLSVALVGGRRRRR